MISDNPNRRPVVVATIAASLLMLILGLTYRLLAARLLTPVSETPINPAALEGFPMAIADWTGHDVPLDEAEAILRTIGADAFINRRYLRRSGSESVSLFIAASGVAGGTLVGHGPEICNVYSGYKPGNHRSVELPLNDGTMLPCRILQFSRGSLSVAEHKRVLYYYMADGQPCGSRSVLRYKVRRGPSVVRCVAQVQMAASSTETMAADSAERIVSEFAVDSASSIARLFKDIEKTGSRRTDRRQRTDDRGQTTENRSLTSVFGVLSSVLMLPRGK